MRREFPLRPDLNHLQGEQVGDAEYPMVYYQRMKRTRQMETDSDPDADYLHTTMFRKVLLDGLPEKVKSRLEDVVGLAYKPEVEFCEYLTHAIEKYRKEKKKQKYQEKDIVRKVAQLQFNELTAGLKGKKKVQVPLLENEEKPKIEEVSIQAQVTQAPVFVLPRPQPQQPVSPQTQACIPANVPVPGPYLPQQGPIIIYAQQPQGQQQQQPHPRF